LGTSGQSSSPMWVDLMDFPLGKYTVMPFFVGRTLMRAVEWSSLTLSGRGGVSHI
jgi:hypothetical protein